jgi:hypothetical protein
MSARSRANTGLRWVEPRTALTIPDCACAPATATLLKRSTGWMRAAHPKPATDLRPTCSIALQLSASVQTVPSCDLPRRNQHVSRQELRRHVASQVRPAQAMSTLKLKGPPCEPLAIPSTTGGHAHGIIA